MATFTRECFVPIHMQLTRCGAAGWGKLRHGAAVPMTLRSGGLRVSEPIKDPR